MRRQLFSRARTRSGFWHFIALSVLSGMLVASGCGGGGQPAEPVPVEEPAPVAPPPPEPQPEPESEPGPDISQARVPADHAIWAPDDVGLLLGLDGKRYEGYSPATVARIQQALSDQGFYSGAVDSDFDRETMEAVADFQAAHNLDLTGVPTPRTRLALRPDANASSAQAAQAFLVQVGVFSNPANSERLTNRLRELNFEVQTETTEDGLHAVRVGPFQDRSSAEEAARAIGEATSLSPLVMRN